MTYMGISNNSGKDFSILFTNRRIIEDFEMSCMGGVRFNLRDTVKYLCVTLDNKLSWTANLENILQRAQIAHVV